jgi:hypothetical protein
VVPVSAARQGRVLEDADAIALAVTTAAGAELASAWRLRVVVTGEALAGDEAADRSAFASEPAVEPILPLDVVLASTGAAWRLTSPSSALGHERRYTHRRTQRGKQQRRRTRTPVGAVAQPRLFKQS